MSNHPTGIAGAFSSLILLVAGLAGVDLSPELAVAIVGAIVTVVSALTPRDNSMTVIRWDPPQLAPLPYEGSE